MIHTKRTLVKNMNDQEAEMSLYRRRFPFPLPEGVRCVLFEENAEISVRIYRASSKSKPYDWENAQIISLDDESNERIAIRLERQASPANTHATVRLFSEKRLSCSTDRLGENAYYTLHICEEDGTLVLFRAFSMSEGLAHKLFDEVCVSSVDCASAVDVYRESRERILRELWLCSL